MPTANTSMLVQAGFMQVLGLRQRKRSRCVEAAWVCSSRVWLASARNSGTANAEQESLTTHPVAELGQPVRHGCGGAGSDPGGHSRAGPGAAAATGSIAIERLGSRADPGRAQVGAARCRVRQDPQGPRRRGAAQARRHQRARDRTADPVPWPRARHGAGPGTKPAHQVRRSRRLRAAGRFGQRLLLRRCVAPGHDRHHDGMGQFCRQRRDDRDSRQRRRRVAP